MTDPILPPPPLVHMAQGQKCTHTFLLLCLRNPWVPCPSPLRLPLGEALPNPRASRARFLRLCGPQALLLPQGRVIPGIALQIRRENYHKSRSVSLTRRKGPTHRSSKIIAQMDAEASQKPTLAPAAAVSSFSLSPLPMQVRS